MRKLFLTIILFLPQIQYANERIQTNLKKKTNLIYNEYIKEEPEKKKSVLAKRIAKQKKTAETGFVLLPYKPNYILPYYYSSNTALDQNLPKGNTSINHSEFKFQFSILAPLFTNLYKKKISIIAAYTQLSYWQVYNQSQWFRETNYEPEIMASYMVNQSLLTNLGFIHQSNGRGGDQEKSWNRLFWSTLYSKNNWLLSAKFWLLVFKNQSSNLHNAEIAKYLGHEEFLYNYKFPNQSIFTFMLRNIENPRYATFNLNYSYPLINHINLYFELFHGYGQSLIEFKTKTTSFGLGINLSNWI